MNNGKAIEKKVLYIEGTSDLDNGNLRKAFATLLEKELKGKMPQVIMGDGISQTVDKFMSKPLQTNERRYLLIDSDQFLTEDVREAIMKKYNDAKPNRKKSMEKENSFFMVQEAEAWILSQPEVLEDARISTESLPKKNVMEIQKPSLELARLYKNSQKEYHKVIEFVKVFPLLDSQKLRASFEEYNRLIITLQ